VFGMIRDYACGHTMKTDLYYGMTIDEKRDYIKWKYTVGSNGTKTYCFHCFKLKEMLK